MAYFAVIGTFLTDSCGPQVLTDVGVLASCFLNGILSGSHYSRYKRIHVLISLALQMLHFERFMSEYGPPPPHSLDS